MAHFDNCNLCAFFNACLIQKVLKNACQVTLKTRTLALLSKILCLFSQNSNISKVIAVITKPILRRHFDERSIFPLDLSACKFKKKINGEHEIELNNNKIKHYQRK